MGKENNNSTGYGCLDLIKNVIISGSDLLVIDTDKIQEQYSETGASTIIDMIKNGKACDVIWDKFVRQATYEEALRTLHFVRGMLGRTPGGILMAQNIMEAIDKILASEKKDTASVNSEKEPTGEKVVIKVKDESAESENDTESKISKTVVKKANIDDTEVDDRAGVRVVRRTVKQEPQTEQVAESQPRCACGCKAKSVNLRIKKYVINSECGAVLELWRKNNEVFIEFINNSLGEAIKIEDSVTKYSDFINTGINIEKIRKQLTRISLSVNGTDDISDIIKEFCL